MNTSDIKNPEYAILRRVENGWVMAAGEHGMGCYRQEHVFHTPKQLAAFIEENFRLVKREEVK